MVLLKFHGDTRRKTGIDFPQFLYPVNNLSILNYLSQLAHLNKRINICAIFCKVLDMRCLSGLKRVMSGGRRGACNSRQGDGWSVVGYLIRLAIESPA